MTPQLTTGALNPTPMKLRAVSPRIIPGIARDSASALNAGSPEFCRHRIIEERSAVWLSTAEEVWYAPFMVIHETERELVEQAGVGIQGVAKRILLGPKDGFSGYLRQFTLAPSGHTPFHSHDWYHAVFVLEGRGKLRLDDTEHELQRGSVVFVEAQRKHNFVNTGASEMRFLCLVPENGDSY